MKEKEKVRKEFGFSRNFSVSPSSRNPTDYLASVVASDNDDGDGSVIGKRFHRVWSDPSSLLFILSRSLQGSINNEGCLDVFLRRHGLYD